MNTFLTVLANDYRRTVSRLAGTIVMTVVMFVMIVLAVYITGLQQIQGHIAFITGGSAITVPAHPDYLEVTTVRMQPPRSDLYKQKYDAFVSIGTDGILRVETLRNNRFRSMVAAVFTPATERTGPAAAGYGSDPSVPESGDAGRGIGVNIIGFLMMFLLMQAFSNLFVFADDKEQGQLVRIASTPVSFSVYLAAHCVYSLSLIAPAWFMLAILHLCGVSIGFTLAGYALLILVIGLFGISIALLLNTFIKKPDNASMLGNAVLMLASLVSGSFYAAPPEHSFLNLVVRCLPQKAVMDFAQALAAGTVLHHIGYLLYVVCCALVLLCLSGTVLHRKYTAKI